MTWIVIAVVVYSAWMYVYAMGARSTAAAPAKPVTKESFVGMGVNQAEDFEAEERFETKRAAADEKKKTAGEPDKDMQTIFEDLSQASETLNAVMKRFKEKLYPSAKEAFAATAAVADAHEGESEGEEPVAPVKKKAAATSAPAKKKKAAAPVPPVEEETFEEPLPEEFEVPVAVPPPAADADAESFAAPRRVTAPVTRFRRVEGFANAPAPARMRARYVQAPYTGVQSSAFFDSMEWVADD